MENLFKCDLSSKKDTFLDILNTFFLNSIENQSFLSEENDVSGSKKKGLDVHYLLNLKCLSLFNLKEKVDFAKLFNYQLL